MSNFVFVQFTGEDAMAALAALVAGDKPTAPPTPKVVADKQKTGFAAQPELDIPDASGND